MDQKSRQWLSELSHYNVAQGDHDIRGWRVVGATGERLGTVRDLLVDTGRLEVETVAIDTDRGQRILVSPSSIDLDVEHRAVQLSTVPGQDSRNAGTDEPDGARVTRAEEELLIGKRTVKAGEVVIDKRVDIEHVSREVPKSRDRVRIERRPVQQQASGTKIADRDDAIVIPVMEEELVIEKRPVIKEELVITKETHTDYETVDVDLRRERVEIRGEADIDNRTPESRQDEKSGEREKNKRPGK